MQTTPNVTACLNFWRLFLLAALIAFDGFAAAPLPEAAKISAVKLLEVPGYCEGVVFDHDGNGYVSWKDTITKFTLDGKASVWAVTGAPNGHKILADGTHLVCDGSRHAVLHLDAKGGMLAPASTDCRGQPLRAPNDLTLDARHAGFYFTDPGDSDESHLIGTVHYVDAKGETHLVADKLAFPNGIVLVPGGKKLFVDESKKNRVLEYEVLAPGRLGAMKVFADLPAKEVEQIDNQPDGMCLDTKGNLYVAHYGMRQVQVLNPRGKLIVRYPGGNLTTSNVAFGGPKHDQLFITGGLTADPNVGGLFRLDLGVKGLIILPKKQN